MAKHLSKKEILFENAKQRLKSFRQEFGDSKDSKRISRLCRVIPALRYSLFRLSILNKS